MMPPDPLLVISIMGGQFLDPVTGLPTADSPRNVEALTWYRDLIRAQGTPEEVNAFRAGFGDEQGINNPFLVGKVAMMFNGQWNPYWFQRYGPKVRYGATAIPYPAARPKLRRSTYLGGNLFCLPTGGRHRKEAWEFLRWSQTVEAQALFASTIHGVPNLTEARRSPQLRQGESWKEAFAVFMDIADSPNARHFPVTPISGLYQAEMKTAADFVRFGKRTPEAALKDVQARVLREARRWQ
jgi:multiple sugar transport system substrate-binding protein